MYPGACDSEFPALYSEQQLQGAQKISKAQLRKMAPGISAAEDAFKASPVCAAGG